MLNAALSVQDAHAKALASFLFREIVEDAHEKYNIFQEDMKELRVWNGMIRRKRSSWRKKWMCCAPLLNRELPPARFGGAPGGVLISFNPLALRAAASSSRMLWAAEAVVFSTGRTVRVWA